MVVVGIVFDWVVFVWVGLIMCLFVCKNNKWCKCWVNIRVQVSGIFCDIECEVWESNINFLVFDIFCKKWCKIFISKLVSINGFKLIYFKKGSCDVSV